MAINNHVVDSRFSRTELTLRRRRACYACKHKWTTFEIAFETYEAMQNELATLRRDIELIRRVVRSIDPVNEPLE